MTLLCGLDEAGRGPLAGPVCAAAVILPPEFPVDLLDDSKKLTERRRETAMRAIYGSGTVWGVAWASAAEIDAINILRASMLAMERAFAIVRAKLPDSPIEAVADGLHAPSVGVPCRALPKADANFPAVMAASILAKTARDRAMERFSWIYPEYGFDSHKGYPTREHVAAIEKWGPSPLQRMSFRWRGDRQIDLFP